MEFSNLLLKIIILIIIFQTEICNLNMYPAYLQNL